MAGGPAGQSTAMADFASAVLTNHFKEVMPYEQERKAYFRPGGG